MVGDGTNDVVMLSLSCLQYDIKMKKMTYVTPLACQGALKRAHVGISVVSR